MSLKNQEKILIFDAISAHSKAQLIFLGLCDDEHERPAMTKCFETKLIEKKSPFIKLSEATLEQRLATTTEHINHLLKQKDTFVIKTQQPIYHPDRHESLTDKPWNPEQVKEHIQYITEQTAKAYSPKTLWPVHPDLTETYHLHQPLTSLWMGATGIIWALQQLNKFTSTDINLDYSYFFSNILELQKNSLAEFDPNWKIKLDAPGYLMGLISPLLLQWKLTKDPIILNQLETLIKQNVNNPNNEFMWAAPGSMLAALFLFESTQEQRWKTLYQASADYLINQYHYNKATDCYVWMQDMYDMQMMYVGLVHGFFGNSFSLLRGFDFLSNNQQQLVLQRTSQTLKNTALVDDQFANWPMHLNKTEPGQKTNLLHICHGSPSTIVSMANYYDLLDTPEKKLLLKAGELIWHAGPLKKPWGLCHGTAGNAYPFLKLFTATQDEKWLDRARQFAMHAIEQSKQAEQKHQQLRYDLWCGDVGLAMFLKSSLEETSLFPSLDYF